MRIQWARAADAVRRKPAWHVSRFSEIQSWLGWWRWQVL